MPKFNNNDQAVKKQDGEKTPKDTLANAQNTKRQSRQL